MLSWSNSNLSHRAYSYSSISQRFSEIIGGNGSPPPRNASPSWAALFHLLQAGYNLRLFNPRDHKSAIHI
jgi:hypothetical protein